MTTPIENVAADEHAVLTTVVLYPDRWDDVASALRADDFRYGHGLAGLFDALQRQVNEHGGYDIQSLLGAADVDNELVHSLIRETPPAVSRLSHHLARVARAAEITRCSHLVAAAGADLLDLDSDPRQVIEQLVGAVDALPQFAVKPPGYGPFRDWATEAAERPKPWVVPGVIRRQGRLVMTAAEGVGKSTLARQVGVAVAAGRHPFRLHPIPPQRVLIVDAENDPATAVNEDDRIDVASPHGLIITADRQVPDWDSSHLAVWSRPEGIDLRSRRDASWLDAAIRDHRPDLVLAGPIYKLFRRVKGEDDETLGTSIQRVLDRVRVRYDCALWLEHHAPKAQAGHRPLDPFGSSVWLRWPDIGLTLTRQEDQSLVVGRFRGDRYAAPGIPDRLDRGNPWPWVGWWNRDGGAWGP